MAYDTHTTDNEQVKIRLYTNTLMALRKLPEKTDNARVQYLLAFHNQKNGGNQ